MTDTPLTDAQTASVVKIAGFQMTVHGSVVHAEFAREREKDTARWKTLAAILAQRLRSLPESGANRFPDARDRAALEEYDKLMEVSA